MEKCYLTNGGNLLRFHPQEKGFYFQKPNGDFLRQVSNSEAEFLSANCLGIFIPEVPHVEFFPQWNFWKSIQILQDNSNYRWESSCNGGNYSFQTYLDVYFAKFPDGTWKIATIERTSTSADFSYDELRGNFHNGLGELSFSNVLFSPSYTTYEKGVEILEKYALLTSFSDLWNLQYEYIPSKWDNEDKPILQPALSFSDKKEIVILLQKTGVKRIKSRRTRGRNRR